MILVTLGDTTEEALPTYESWLMRRYDNERNGWSKWIDNGRVRKIVTVIY
jgi:hypothetical protein